MTNVETWLSNYNATKFINFDRTLVIDDNKVVCQPSLTSDEIDQVRAALNMPHLDGKFH